MPPTDPKSIGSSPAAASLTAVAGAAQHAPPAGPLLRARPGAGLHLRAGQRAEAERELRAALVRIAGAFTRNLADAEDLVQSTFVRALEHFGTIPLERAHYAWFKTVVRHLAIDLVRQRRRWHMADWDAAELTLTSDDASSAEEDGLALMTHVLALCERGHREVCEMYYLRGQAYAQIASALAIPIATVGTRLHRARASLAARIDELRDADHGALERITAHSSEYELQRRAGVR